MRIISFLLFGVFMASSSAFGADQNPPVKPRPMMTRHQCRVDASDVYQSVNKALDEVHKAQKDGDNAKLKDALADAEKALQKVQDHMESCAPGMRGRRGPHMMRMQMTIDRGASAPDPEKEK